MDQPSIFVSYAWEAENECKVVDSLEKALNASGIQLNRDIHLQFKDSITGFMDALGRADCIVVVLSKPYLESKNCMSELLAIHENGEFRQRVFPIVLEGTKIYDAENRIPYLKYWNQKTDDLKSQMSDLDPTHTKSIHESLDLYADIRRGIDGLMDILGDMNTPTREVHVETNFQTLIAKIKEKFPNCGATTPDENTEEEFRELVRSNLKSEIERKVCEQFQQALCNEIGQSDIVQALENSCRNKKGGLEQAIGWLYSATKKTLKDLFDRGSTDQDRFFGAAETILGWLILLSVNDHWFGKNRAIFEDGAKNIRMDIPVQADTSIEIVLSRYNQVPALFEINETGSAAFGRNVLDTAVPEAGWGKEANWQEIKLSIWNWLFTESRSKHLSVAETRRLQGVLEFRNKEEGNNYYFTIKSIDQNNPLSNQDILAKFREELPALRLISIGVEGGESVLLASEIGLEVLIMEFLNLRRTGYEH